MDEKPKKRRGPITLMLLSRRFRWAVISLIALQLLYVVSFGLVLRFASAPGISSQPAPSWLYCYAPIFWTVRRLPGGDYALMRFALVFMPPGTEIGFPSGYSIQR